MQAPKNWVDYYRDKLGPEEPYLGDKGYYPNLTPKATYAAMISYLDEQVGEIVAKLKEMGVYENTFIVFSSDNGPTHKDEQADIHFFNSTGIFVNSKILSKVMSMREGLESLRLQHGHIKLMVEDYQIILVHFMIIMLRSVKF